MALQAGLLANDSLQDDNKDVAYWRKWNKSLEAMQGRHAYSSFRVLVFVEELLIHVLFPLSLPFLYLFRGRASVINHEFLNPAPLAIFFVWVVGVAVPLANLLFFIFLRNHAGNDEILDSPLISASRQLVFVCDAVFLARCAVLACKYALFEEPWLHLSRTLVLPPRVKAARLISNWVNPPIDVLMHELEVAASRVGGPLLREDRAYFVFDPQDRKHLNQIKRALLPTHRLRELIRRYAPSLKISNGRVPVRLVVLSAVVQAIQRHQINAVRVAMILIAFQCGICLACDIGFGHTANLFVSPYSSLLPAVWVLAYVSYSVFASYMLAYVFIGALDTRRRYRALKYLNLLAQPMISIHVALRGLGVDSNLHSAILRAAGSGSDLSTQSTFTSTSDLTDRDSELDGDGDGDGEEGHVESESKEGERNFSVDDPDRDPDRAALLSDPPEVRSNALFMDWKDEDGAALQRERAISRAYGPNAGAAASVPLLADEDDAIGVDSGEGDNAPPFNPMYGVAAGPSMSTVGFDSVRPTNPQERGSRAGAPLPLAGGGGGEFGDASHPWHGRDSWAGADSKEGAGPRERGGHTSTVSGDGMRRLQQRVLAGHGGDSDVYSQEVGAGERPAPGMWERAASRLALGHTQGPGHGAAREAGAGVSPAQVGDGYVAMGGVHGEPRKWRSRTGEQEEEKEGAATRPRAVSHDTASVPTVSLSRPSLSLHVSQNVHAFLWSRQVVKNFGHQFKKRLEFYMSFAVLLLICMVLWLASGLFKASSSGGSTVFSQGAAIVAPILVSILGVSISLMVRDGIKTNNLALHAKEVLIAQEDLARSFWRDLSIRRQACVTKHVTNTLLAAEAARDHGAIAVDASSDTTTKVCRTYFQHGKDPAGEAKASDLAVTWAARRIADTSVLLHTAAVWLFVDSERNPVTLFGIRTNVTLLRSLYTVAVSGLSVGIRFLITLYQDRRRAQHA